MSVGPASRCRKFEFLSDNDPLCHALDQLRTDMLGFKLRAGKGARPGHIAGEKWSAEVYERLKQQVKAQRQHEFLNAKYRSHLATWRGGTKHKLVEGRHALLPPPLAGLINRGKDATGRWSPSLKLRFKEQQQDTADIIITEPGGLLHLLDVKSVSLDKEGQKANLISATKVATMCDEILTGQQFPTHDFIYIGVTWREVPGGFMQCSDVSFGALFKAQPHKLYINWGAGRQIQEHIDKMDQSYDKDAKQWCLDYLRYYVAEAEKGTQSFRDDYITPYQKYIP